MLDLNRAEDGTFFSVGHIKVTMREEQTVCPLRGLLDQVGDKWSVLVIRRLNFHGTLRFSELKREIEGISQRMLTATLRDLERNGLATRTAYPTVPVKVEYALTVLGTSLAGAVASLASWADSHHPEMLAAQQQFNAHSVDRDTED